MIRTIDFEAMLIAEQKVAELSKPVLLENDHSFE